MQAARHRMSEHGTGSQPRRSIFRTILPYVNLTLAAVISVGLVGLTHRIVEGENEKRSLEMEIIRTRHTLDDVRRNHSTKISGLAAEDRAVVASREADLNTYTSMINDIESRIVRIENETKDHNDQTVATFRKAIDDLRGRMTRQMKPRKTVQEVFRDFESDFRGGIVLIYTEFDFYKIREGEDSERRTVSGWGSGFYVTREGHIVTNKHVIQPWKFDPDLAAMVALGEIRIDETSLKVACWEQGMKALDDEDEPILSTGFNNTERNNLKIFAIAKDSMREKDMELGALSPTYSTHALDDHDIVILKAHSKQAFRALPLATAADTAAVHKLDPVMALGFPRGQNGLEGRRVESSPSIGTVRKVERTIHVTASIIPGNSGGPLIGPRGRVLGIVTRVYSETLGICLKIEHAMKLLKEETARIAAKN